MSGESALSLLLGGSVSPEAFLEEYWGRNFLVARGDSERFSGLYSWDSLSEAMSTHRFVFPRLRLFTGGKVIPSDQYMSVRYDRRGNPYSRQNAGAVEALMRSGALLHITSLGETSRPLASFAAMLERDLMARVQVNLHAGFAAAKGFHIHWDGHDVYAVQIAGRKRWRLFGFTEEAPLAVPPEAKRGAPTKAVWEGVLDTGDMLYIPRGYWHATEYVDQGSLHLTFAVQHPTGIDFLEWAVAQLTAVEALRRDMPRHLFANTGKDTYEEWLQLIRSATQTYLTGDVLDRFVAAYSRSLGATDHVNLVPEE